MNANQWRHVFAALYAASALALAGCEQTAGSTPIEFSIPVTTEAVATRTIEDAIRATGSVRAPEVITLTVMNAGLLQVGSGPAGKLAEGDRVKAGTLIASITGEDVRLAARMRTARQRLAEAKENLNAVRALQERNMASARELSAARTKYEEALQEFETSRHSENSSRIVTPIDGVILGLARQSGQPMADGQLVNRGQEIARIAPVDKLVVDVDLISSDVARVTPGQTARVHHHAWPERAFTGRVLRIAPTMDQRTRSVRAEVEVDNADALLKPGMFVEATVVIEQRADVAVVPRRALTQRGGRKVVFVVDGERAEQRAVETGLGDDSVLEVREGLAAGEHVVVRGLETLADGMPVRNNRG